MCECRRALSGLRVSRVTCPLLCQPTLLLEDSQFFESLFDGEMANQARQEWERAMAELAQEEPELLGQFHKLSEAAGKVGACICPAAPCVSAPCSLYIRSGSQGDGPISMKEPLWYSPAPRVNQGEGLLTYVLICLLSSYTGTDLASQQEFTSCLKDTLTGLAKNTDSLQVDTGPDVS